MTQSSAANEVVSLVDVIVSKDPCVRDTAISDYCSGRSRDELLEQCRLLEAFVDTADDSCEGGNQHLANENDKDGTDNDDMSGSNENLYTGVRAMFFLSAIHRYYLHQADMNGVRNGTHNNNNGDMTPTERPRKIPPTAHTAILERRFSDAISILNNDENNNNNNCYSPAISSGLAHAWQQRGLERLGDAVQRAVQEHPGNQWMFCQLQSHEDEHEDNSTAVKHHRHHPLLWKLPYDRALRERTPVRMDLSHQGWSDIFFLGMDFPEGARVLNISVDLAVHPISHTRRNNNRAYSTNGNGTTNPTEDSASPVTAPQPPVTAIWRTLDRPVLVLTSVDLKQSVELTEISQVFDFCKDYLGLLRAGIIAAGIVPPSMEHVQGSLQEHILEPLLGAGKGLELVTTVHDIPKGSRLAVSTNLLACIIAVSMRCTGQTESLTGALTESERRLVAARAILGEWLGGSGGGWQDSAGLWPGLKLITGVPAVPGDAEYGRSRGRLLPHYEQLNTDAQVSPTLLSALKESLVLVHGGMAQNVGPVLEMVTERYLLRDTIEWEGRRDAAVVVEQILQALRDGNVRDLARALTRNFEGPIQTIIPWATNLYTETLIDRARERFGDKFWGFWMLGGMSGGGMGFLFDPSVKSAAMAAMQEIMSTTKEELRHALPFAIEPVVYDFKVNQNGSMADLVNPVNSVAKTKLKESGSCSFYGDDADDLGVLLEELGFDVEDHESIRDDLISGKLGLEQNRLSGATEIADVTDSQIVVVGDIITAKHREQGLLELERGTVGVVTLAAGVGSRWTKGAGVCKAIHPFCKLGGRHRSFLEVHLAKSRKMSKTVGTTIPHVITTSFMTERPLEKYLAHVNNHKYEGTVYQSSGKAVGLRLIPTIRDLKFAWQEQQQQKLDGQAQKVRESAQNAIMRWAASNGEGSDYRDNIPLQCLHPVGHYYEIPNLLLNGTLLSMITKRPQLKTLLLHNVDTVGTDVNPGILGLFLERSKAMAFEVMPRQLEDQGGGLACVNGVPRLVEGMALPCEEDEHKCSYYNSMTTWIDIDSLLSTYGISRVDLSNTDKVASSVHQFSRHLPSYVTLKEVKNRWGNGQEDLHTVTQFERLWGDMSAIVESDFFVVPRRRAQQLKDPSQLDGWVREGSAAYLEGLCHFQMD